METLDAKSVVADCTVDHFSAVADILIRRPHVIRSRVKLVAGAQIIHQEPFETPSEDITPEFVKNLRSNFSDSKVELPEEDFSQQELDYSQGNKIVRRIVYKNEKDSRECVLWTLSHCGACLHVIPLDVEDIAEENVFANTKAHFSIAFDRSKNQVFMSPVSLIFHIVSTVNS